MVKTSKAKYIWFGDILVEVIHKKIKHVYLYVKSPDAQVQVRAPFMVSDRQIQAFLASKQEWLHHKRQQILSRPKTIEYAYMDGEIHYFNGEAYQLKVLLTSKKQRIELVDDHVLMMFVRKDSTTIQREKILNSWYKEHLIKLVRHYVAMWEPIMGVKVSDIGIKKMNTKWGTCNIKTQKIWLSIKLAKKSPQCVEYVVVHEMVHLLERLHNQRFKKFMSQFLPNWKELSKQLHDPID